MNGKNKREQLQERAILDITEKNYSPNTIMCAEYPTGSGKSKILLASARKIMKEQNSSVIISTSNNALVTALRKEALKHGYEDDIEIMIGKKNYVDREKVFSPEFLTETKLDIEDITGYLKTFESAPPLAYEFVSYFKLDPKIEDEIKIDDLSADSDISMVSRMIDMTTGRKIYITNHYYLLSMYRIIGISKEDNADIKPADRVILLPLLVDEGQELNNVAKTIFMSSFSPFRMYSIIHSFLNEDHFSKTAEKNARRLIQDFNELSRFFVKKEDNSKNRFAFYVYARSILESKKMESFIKSIRGKLKSKTKCSNRCRMMSKKILGEIDSYRKVISTEYDLINVSVSPIRKFGSIQTITEEPSFSLKNMFWIKNRSFVCCVSGTFCIARDTGREANKWSFLRMGFIPYKKDQDSEYPTIEFWNNRLRNHFIFKVEEPIFQKNQARHIILEDKRFLPPSYKEKGKVQELSKLWIKNLAEEMATNLIYKNTVILMSSFENCEELKNEIHQFENIRNEYAILYSMPNKTARALQEEYMSIIKAGKKAILIGNLTFYVGIDLPNEYLTTLIIGKLPFEPEDKFISRLKVANAFSRIMNNTYKAIITFRQGLGRGIRSEEDRVFIAICDPRILKGRYSSFLYFLQRFSIKMD